MARGRKAVELCVYLGEDRSSGGFQRVGFSLRRIAYLLKCFSSLRKSTKVGRRGENKELQLYPLSSGLPGQPCHREGTCRQRRSAESETVSRRVSPISNKSRVTNRLSKTYKSPIRPTKSATSTAADLERGNVNFSFGARYAARFRRHLNSRRVNSVWKRWLLYYRLDSLLGGGIRASPRRSRLAR